MTQQQSGWQAPEAELGPAPGVEFATYGARIVGYIIDGIILGVIVAVIWLIVSALFLSGASFTIDSTGNVQASSITISGGAIVASVLAFFATLIITLFYFPWFWSHGGQTPGQRMMGIQVVRDIDGGPVSGGAAILRLLGYWISGIVFYLGYIWVFIDKRRRGWFDLIAGTVVIKAR
jgi:uncharacterized RDD family membrane protein YckC